MTISIAICDDEAEYISFLSDYLLRFQLDFDVSIKLFTCSAGNELLKICQKELIDIIFLDIEMPGNDGIGTAKMIRARHNPYIVFFTSHTEYMRESFSVKPFDYVSKNIAYNELKDVLLRIFKDMEISEKHLNLHNSAHEIISINIDDITYFESSIFKKNITTVHLNNNSTLETFETLNVLEEQLKEHYFFRTDRSYIINLRFAFRFFDKSVELRDGTIIPVSRRRTNELKTAFSNYIFIFR